MIKLGDADSVGCDCGGFRGKECSTRWFPDCNHPMRMADNNTRSVSCRVCGTLYREFDTQDSKFHTTFVGKCQL